MLRLRAKCGNRKEGLDMIFRFLKRILQVSGKHGTNIRQSFVFSILESICQKVPIGLAAITIIKLMNQELYKRSIAKRCGV